MTGYCQITRKGLLALLEYEIKNGTVEGAMKIVDELLRREELGDGAEQGLPVDQAEQLPEQSAKNDKRNRQYGLSALRCFFLGFLGSLLGYFLSLLTRCLFG